MTDLWRFQRWAREQKLGNPTRKLILTSLAITAEANTGSGFMAQSDLAEYAECSTRTVSGHLKMLQDAGYIARRKRFSKSGRRLADGFLLLVGDVTEWPDGEPVTTGSGAPPEDSSTGDLTQSPPEAQASGQELPIEKPLDKGERNARAPEEDPRLQPPRDFPDELRSHARHVLPLLQAVAEQHNAKRVWPLQLGKLMMRFRRRPLVATAHRLDEWAVDPPRPIKDVVRTYETFLDRERDLEGVEQLGADGFPTQSTNGDGRSRGGTAGRSGKVTRGNTSGREIPDYDAGMIRNGPTP